MVFEVPRNSASAVRCGCADERWRLSRRRGEVEKLRIRRFIAARVLLLVCASASLWAVDPHTHLSQYAHTAWRVQDGFLNGTPTAIAQTADGYLWVGTVSGLSRFDGIRFTPFLSPDHKLESSGVFSLLGVPDGSLWIGTGSNLARLDRGVVANFTNGLGRINAIVRDRNGAIWSVRSRPRDDGGPLCQVAGTDLMCKGKADGIDVPYAVALVEDLDGNLWIGGSNCLTRWRPGSSATFIPPALRRADNLAGVSALAVTRDGSIWSGIARKGHGMGLQQWVKGSWRPFDAPGLKGEELQVGALLVDSANALWVGTESQGIYRIHEGKAEHFTSANGLSSDTVTGFYEDREGNIWVATTEGIDSFRDLAVLTFSTRDGLSFNLANSVLAARDGAVWIGNHGSLDCLRGDKLISIPIGSGQRVTSLFEDHAGRLWVGIDNDLFLYREGRFEKIEGTTEGQIGTVIAIAEDREHDIWAEAIGRPTRLLHIQGLKVREEFPAPEMPVAAALEADPNGGLWLGLANGGLARYWNRKIEPVPIAGVQNVRALQLLARQDGSLLGASASGLIYGRDGAFRMLTARDGLACDSVYSLVPDRDRGVWLYAQCGIIHVPGGELDKWWKNGGSIANLEIFDVFDGARPYGTPFQPHASRSPDGRMWFANETVVQVLDPSHLRRNTLAPPVQIERFLADRKSYPSSNSAILPALTRDLEIDYTALSFRAPQKVRFRYRLEGHDTDWQESGTRRQAFYNDLPPGPYRFRVIAGNNDGVWNDAGATLDFRIAPAWFQTAWFYVLCALGALSVAAAIFNARMRYMRKLISARFDERLAERLRMARDLHDTFLQTLQGSKLVADDALERASDQVHLARAMEQISAWLDRAIHEGRTALNSLRTSTTQTNDLAEAFKRAAEESRAQSRMQVSFSVTGDSKEMHPVVRDEIYRIGYEAIRNASTHSHGDRLEVTLRYGKDLALSVSDNGVGIDPTFAEGGRNGHFGLQSMHERAARIGGKLRIVSSPDSGTDVTITVPGNVIFRKSLSLPARVGSAFRRIGRKSASD